MLTLLNFTNFKNHTNKKAHFTSVKCAFKLKT